MNGFHFLPGDRCEVGGLRFRYGTAVAETTPQEAFLCKDRAFLDAYVAVLPKLAPRRVRAITAQDFADAPPDLILDDASHQYGPTRRSFEIAFPLLRKGGHYIIEDWSWAHWPETQGGRVWSDNIAPEAPAMTNLIFELVMLLPSTGLIERIDVRQGFVVIEKSHRDIESPVFSLDALIRSRGRRLNLI